MNLFFRILKTSGLVMLIVAFAILLGPTLRGPFVVIHYSTALRGWLLAQLVMISFCLAAGMVCRGSFSPRVLARVKTAQASRGEFSAARPLRC